jgi:hypothetical protein
LALVWLVLLVPSAAEETAGQPQIQTRRITGSFRTLIELEQDDLSGTDLDAGAYLRLNVYPFVNEHSLFHFYGRLRFDLDGESPTDDALKGSDQRIFQAYLELRQWPRPLDIRLGRQWVHEVEGVYLDGCRFDVALRHNLGLTLFGGRPASAYSSRQHQYLVGGRASFSPFKATTLRLTGVRSDEDHPEANDQIGFHVSQTLWKTCRLYGDYKILNTRDKEIRLGGNGLIPAIQLELRGSYYHRLNRIPNPRKDDVEARYFSDYFLLLDSVETLDRYALSATKYLGEHFAVGGGFSVTSIKGKENPTNRESEHYFVSFQVFHLPIKRLTFSVDANLAKASFSNHDETLFTDVFGQQEEVTTTIKQDDQSFFITGQVDYQFSKAFRASVGSAYGDFDFERVMRSDQQVLETVPRSFLFTSDGEKFITRTYFVELDYKLNVNWSTRLLIEYNHSKINTGSDPDDYGRVVSSILYRF